MNKPTYHFDPTEHGYPKGHSYPLLVFLPGLAGSIADTRRCAEAFSCPIYQSDFQGAYLLIPPETDSDPLLLKSLIEGYASSHSACIGKQFLFCPYTDTSALTQYADYFDALIPVGLEKLPEISGQMDFDMHGIRIFPVKNAKAVCSNLINEDGSPEDQRYPRGITGWIDEVNRDGRAAGREYISRKPLKRTGHVRIDERISLFYEEYGSGDRIILSAQVGFFHRGMHQRMADLGYHVFCITLRGFHPSTLISEDYGDRWYDVFSSDVVAFADRMGIQRFSYMGASHGAGVGWHLMLQAQDRVDAFIAVVPGPHSLAEGTMSYRLMLEQGIIKSPPPFDPPIDSDPVRQARRDYRNNWISSGMKSFEQETKLDYGRPMMRFGTEEKLCEALRSITVPVLMIGGYDDPISTPALMMRTAGCLPHCKWIVYSNCGHNIDTDLIEEVSDEADRFIRNALATGKVYLPLE